MTTTWTIGGNEYSQQYAGGLFIRDQYKNIIADHIKTTETAKLIAASPAMYAALQRLQTWLIAPAFDADTVAEMQRIVSEAMGDATSN